MNVPLFGIDSARQSMGITFSEGPRRSTIETVPDVVGYGAGQFGRRKSVVVEDVVMLRY